MIKKPVKIGGIYSVIGTYSGHSFSIGEKVKVIANKGGGLWACEAVTDKQVWNLYDRDLEVAPMSRPERLADLQKENDEHKATILKNEVEIERLKKFASDEDEVAYLIVTAADPSKTEAERCNAIAAVLRERTKTDFI